MATATWFDYNAYMANKLVQVNAIDPKVQYTPETLKAEFEKAGYVGEEGAFKHFEQYGKTEDVAPNALFDADEYIVAKAADFFTTDKPTASQIAEVAKAFADGGMSAWDHYVTYGSSEGVEPSFSFNTDAYLTAKAAALNAGKYDGKENWTAEDVAAAIKASGSTVLEHFMANGGGGELEVAVTYKGIAEGGVKNPFIDPTPPTPVPDPNPGDTFTLGTGHNEIAGTEKDDIINGVSSGLSAEKTLKVDDTIDGGEGIDTLNVEMKGNFAGFTKDKGFMTDVEVVNLSAAKGSTSTFTAKGISGVTNYNIDASKGAKISLAELADTGAVIGLKGQDSGDFKVGYASTAVSGAADAASLTLEGVGKVKTAATGTNTAVTLKTDGIESLTITATGDNFVKLGSATVEKLVLAGKGNISVEGVSTGLTTVDAGNTTGTVDVNLAGAAAGKVSEVTLGHGNDTLTTSAANLVANASIDGGLGEDNLVLNTGAAATLGLTMAGVETVTVGSQSGGALTFSGANVIGLSNIVIGKDVAANVLFANMGTGDYNLAFKGANATAATMTMDHSGLTNVTMSANKAGTAEVNKHSLQLVNTSAVDVVVDKDVSYVGDITAGKAATFTLNAAGALGTTGTTGDLTLTSATSADLNFTGGASILNLSAGKLLELSINSQKDVTVGTSGVSGTDLGALEKLDVITNGTVTMDSHDLGKLGEANLSGVGKVVLGKLGSATLDSSIITVTANSLNGGLELGTVDTLGTNISIDTSKVQGEVKLGAITTIQTGGPQTGDVQLTLGSKMAASGMGTIKGYNVNVDASRVLEMGSGTTFAMSFVDTAMYNGSTIAGNTASATMLAKTDGDASDIANVTFNGGVQADEFSLTADAGSNGNVNLTVQGGGTAKDTLEFDASAITTASGSKGIVFSEYNVEGTFDVTVKGSADFSAASAGITVATWTTVATDSDGVRSNIVLTEFDDTITSMATSGATSDIARIVGGKGKDTITLGSGVDTVVLTSNLAADGDSISSFASNDKIEIAGTGAGNVFEGITSIGTLASSGNWVVSDINVIASGVGYSDAAAIKSVMVNGSVGSNFAASGKIGIVAADSEASTAAGTYNIWYINTMGEGADDDVITLLGTVTTTGSDELAATNFTLS